ncbi:MAG: hypothetical protein WA975_04850 [Mesorhizobium sp.]
MTNHKITRIDGGSAQYWKDRTEGFRLIREAEEAVERLKGEPLYIAGDWDDDYGGYEPVENLEPLEIVEDAIAAIEANETALAFWLRSAAQASASSRSGRLSRSWNRTGAASRTPPATRSGDPTPIEVEARGGTAASRPIIDGEQAQPARPAFLAMKGGQAAPLRLSP